MLLWQLYPGDGPLLIDVPHAGTHLPDAVAARLTPAARAVPDTDWHVGELCAFARGTGIGVMVATHSRYVIDLNRDPSGAPLYPGADNTELCPTRTFADEPVYRNGEAPTNSEVAARRATYYDPYHMQLAAEIARLRARHGYAVVLDLHSILSSVPRFFAGRLPDLNLGTAQGASCAAELRQACCGILASARPFTHVADGRFKGGFITRHYGKPSTQAHVLQLEIAQAAYMDERPPYPFDAARAAPLVRLLERLVVTLSEWRP